MFRCWPRGFGDGWYTVGGWSPICSLGCTGDRSPLPFASHLLAWTDHHTQPWDWPFVQDENSVICQRASWSLAQKKILPPFWHENTRKACIIKLAIGVQLHARPHSQLEAKVACGFSASDLLFCPKWELPATWGCFSEWKLNQTFSSSVALAQFHMWLSYRSVQVRTFPPSPG